MNLDVKTTRTVLLALATAVLSTAGGGIAARAVAEDNDAGQATKSDLAAMQATVLQEMRATLAPLARDVSELKGNVASMQRDITDIRERVARLEALSDRPAVVRTRRRGRED